MSTIINPTGDSFRTKEFIQKQFEKLNDRDKKVASRYNSSYGKLRNKLTGEYFTVLIKRAFKEGHWAEWEYDEYVNIISEKVFTKNVLTHHIIWENEYDYNIYDMPTLNPLIESKKILQGITKSKRII